LFDVIWQGAESIESKELLAKFPTIAKPLYLKM